VLTLCPDLEPLSVLVERADYQRLADGGSVRVVLEALDSEVLAERGIPARGSTAVGCYCRRGICRRRGGRRRRASTSAATGAWHTETVYAFTDLRFDDIRARQLAEIIHDHWLIKVQVHWIRDVTSTEDHSQICTGNGPAVIEPPCATSPSAATDWLDTPTSPPPADTPAATPSEPLTCSHKRQINYAETLPCRGLEPAPVHAVHGDVFFGESALDGSLVGVEVFGDVGGGPAVLVEARGLVDLFGAQAGSSHRNVVAS
jgi:hypothetical protein